ncbi:MAG: coproporphyrinogen III oxidase family protein [Fibrobacter sp.]|nr:coproporphyrinogen III oxidase family protein [Fibrobacter sp.]
MLGIYIHVPFCEKVCDYCDFRVMPASSSNLFYEYTDLLVREMEGFARANPGALETAETLYLGGGTPSLLPGDCLARVFDSLRGLGVDVPRLREVTMEFNPESCNDSTVDLARECGVGRFSLGLQSFRSEILERIGRRHSVEVGLRALELLCSQPGIEVNGDLMFNLPGQSPDQFLGDLDRLADFPLNHVSFYGLTVAGRTRLGHRIARGELSVDEDLYGEMYLRGVDLLGEKGFERYEVSNFCRSGKWSIHNKNYWDRGEYIGFGPGAHSYFRGVRFNAPEIYPRWREFVLNGMPRSGLSLDALTPDDIWTERVWLSLRQSAGLDLDKLRAEGIELDTSSYSKWIKEGCLTLEGNLLRLVGRGWLLMDSVVTDVLNGYIPN